MTYSEYKKKRQAEEKKSGATSYSYGSAIRPAAGSYEEYKAKRQAREGDSSTFGSARTVTPVNTARQQLEAPGTVAGQRFQEIQRTYGLNGQRMQSLLDNYNRYYTGTTWRTKEQNDSYLGAIANAKRQNQQVRDWYTRYKDVYGDDATKILSQLDEMDKWYDDLSGRATKAADYYNQYASQDEWDKGGAMYAKYLGKTPEELERVYTQLGGSNTARTPERQGELETELRSARSAWESVQYDSSTPQETKDRLKARYDRAQAAIDSYASPETGKRANEAEWLRNYIDSGSAALAATQQRYGVDLDSMTPGEIITWRNSGALDDKSRAVVDDYIRARSQSDGRLGTGDFARVAEDELLVKQMQQDIPATQYQILDDAALLSNANRGVEAYNRLREYMAATGKSYDEANTELQALMRYKADEARTENLKALREQSKGNPLMSALSIAAQPAINLSAQMDILSARATGNDVRSTDPGIAAYQGNQTIRQQRGQEWNDALQSIGLREGAGQWLYNSLMSTADSAVNMALTQGALGLAAPATQLGRQAVSQTVSNLIMGSGAAVDTYISSMQQGVDPDRALVRSMLSGFIEGVTEAVGGERVFENIISDKTLTERLLMSFLSEGTEEYASNELNRFVNRAFFSDVSSEEDMVTIASNITALIFGYKEAGYSTREAWLKAMETAAGEDASSFLAGGLSGLLMGVGGAGIRSVNDYSSGRQMIREGYNNAANIATLNREAAELGVNAPELTEGSRAYQLGRTARLTTEARTGAQAQQAVTEATAAIEAELNRIGYEGDAHALAEAMAKQQVMGQLRGPVSQETLEELTPSDEEQRLLRQRYNRQAAQMVQRGIGTELAIGTGGTLSANQPTYLSREDAAGLREGQDAADYVQGKRIALAAARTSSDSEEAVNAATRAVEKMGIDMDKGQIEAIVKANEGEIAKARVDENGSLKLPESASSAAVASLKGIYSRIDDEDARDAFALNGLGAYNLAVNYGQTEYAQQLLAQKLELHPEIRAELQSAYDAGLKERAQGGGAVVARTSTLTADDQRFEKRTGTISKAMAESMGVRTIDLNSLTAEERQRVSVAKALSKVLGVRVALYDTRGTTSNDNGFYRDGTVYLDIRSGDYNGGSMVFTAAHEITHVMRRGAQAEYNALQDFIVDYYYKDGGRDAWDDAISAKMAQYERLGHPITAETATEEVIAESCEDMLTNSQAVRELARKNMTLAQRFKARLDAFVDALDRALKSITGDNVASNRYAAALRESKEAMQKAQELWDNALRALAERAGTEAAAEAVGAVYDAESGSVAPIYSLRTWTESEYVQDRDRAAKELAEALDITEQKARDYIDSINSIAKIITEDKGRLDYVSSPGRSSFVSNVEYGGSFDFSTLCKKRRLLTGTFSAIQRALPNTALTANEILEIRKMMQEKGLEVSCGLCYVEGSRANMGQFTQKFLDLYKQHNPGAWVPNMAQMNTPDGIEQVRIQHPEVYEQYEYFWNHYGTLEEGDPKLFASQQKPKLYQLRTEYKNEILTHFKGDSSVEAKNRNGGVRLQSFSDFEIVHLIDTMQIIMDMSKVGLAGQAYTKVPDFALALGDTGLKINLSLIAKDVDANGQLVFDDVEGMPHDTAFRIRDMYSKDVGTIIVTFTDAQLKAAMADPRIDFIIPFHRSQWKRSQYGAMGLPANTKDYTYMQNEKFLHPDLHAHEFRGRQVRDKASNYMPNEYWDFSKSGRENAENYLRMCAEADKRPKFFKLLVNNGDGSYSLQPDGSTDGYWKLLIDFKMYDNDGVGSPQTPVRPNFNMDEAVRMLNEYKGGHERFPVARGVVDEFVKKYKERNGEDTVYSMRERDADYLASVIEKEINDAGLHLTSKDNNRNNLRINAWLKNNYPDLSIQFFNDKRTGHVTVKGIATKEDAAAAFAEEEARISAERKSMLAREAFARRVSTPSGYRKLYESIKNHLERGGYSDKGVTIHRTRSTVGSLSFYVEDTDNGVTIKISDHNSIRQEMEHPDTRFVNLLELGSIGEVWNRIEEILTHDAGNVIPLSERFNRGEEDIRYSLRVVNPVQPSSDAWQRGHDEAWFVENGYPIYRDVTDEQAAANTETGQDKRGGKHGTQITSTQSTYRQVYDLIQDEHPTDWQKLRILDASSGIGLGTRIGREMGFNVTDIEPYPSRDRYQFDKARDNEATWTPRHPDYEDYSKLEDLVESGKVEGFDYIISNAVLNVIPQDTRDNLTVAMGHLLKPGGQMFVNVISRNYQGALDSESAIQRNAKGVPVGSVRTSEGDYSLSGNVYGRGHETFVWKTNTVQKVFSYNELTAYLRDALGDGYTVEPFKAFGMTAAMVTKDGDDTRHSLRDVTDRQILSEALLDYYNEGPESEALQTYQYRIREMEAKQERLEEVNAQALALKDRTDDEGVNERHRLQREAKKLRDEIRQYDAQIYELEKSMPLRSVITREREAAYKAATAKAGEKLTALEQHWRDKERAALERGRQRLREYRINRDQGEAVKKLRSRIEGNVKDLLQLVTENSDKHHVPDQLREPLADFLNAINLESSQLAGGGPETRRDEQWARKFERLNTAIQQQRAAEAEGTAPDSLYLPDDFYNLMDQTAQAVRTLTEAYGGQESIYSMDGDALRSLDTALKILKHTVKSANQAMVNSYAEKISDIAEGTISHLDQYGAAGVKNGVKGWLDNLIFWQNGTPYYVFKRFGDAGFSTFQSIMDGQGKLAATAEKIIADSKEMFNPAQVKEWQSEIHDVELSDGRTVKMTTAQIMSFHCLAKRQQAVGHLLGGGMKIDAFRQGRQTIDDRTDYVLGVQDITAIDSLLTDEQRRVADDIQRYMSSYGSELGNEVTMRRFGYKAYGESNYFPIVSDKQNLDGTKEEEQRASLLRLLNMSHTKALVDNANNALVVRNIFDVFSEHMSDMAEYNALALPVLDMVRWFNYKRKESGDLSNFETVSTQKSLATAFGGFDRTGDAKNVMSLANQYVKVFLKDLNGNNERGRDIGIGSFMSKYKRASVAANLRVAIQQPMSIMRAGAVIDYKWLAKGVAMTPEQRRQAAEELQTYSNEAKWKGLGYHDIYIGRSVASQIKQDQSTVDKLVDKSMILAEKGDEATWTALWQACKLEQQSRGVDVMNIMDATAKRFQEVVYSTQVMDATTTRSQSMRSNAMINQMWTAFMAEPTLSVNLLADSFVQYRLAARSGGDTTEARKQAFKGTYKTAMRAVTAYAFNAIAVALAESLIDAFRDDDDYETFIEKYLEALGDNWADELNPLSKVTVLKDLINTLFGKYGAGDRMDVAALTNARKSAEILVEMINVNFRGADPTQTTYYGKMTWYGATYQLLKTASQLTGLPFAGLSREAQTLWNNLIYPGARAAGAEVRRLKTYNESAKNTGYPKLYEAITSGDEREAMKLREEMYYNGISDEAVTKGLKEQIKSHYIDGDLDEEMAADLLAEYCGADPAATGGNSINLTLDKWRYGNDYKMSGDLNDALQSGDTGEIKAAVQNQRVRYRRADKDIKDDITKFLKPLLLAGDVTRDFCLRALKATGLYSDDEAKKAVERWTK